jgi:hypothetical protein
MPEDGIGIAILVNSGAGGPLADLVSRYIYDVLRGGEGVEERYAEELERGRAQVASAREGIAADRARRASRPQDLPRPLESYTGVFENDDMGRLELALVEGRLEATMGLAWSAVEVYDNQQDLLRVELTGGGTVVAVEFDPGSTRADRIRALGLEFVRVD